MMRPQKRKGILTWLIALFLNAHISEITHSLEKKRDSSAARNAYIIVLSTWGLFALLLIFSFSYLSLNSTIYDVNASVERLQIYPFGDQKNPDWFLTESDIYSECCNDLLATSGTLIIANDAKIIATRIATGDTHIEIQHPANSESAFLDIDDTEHIFNKVIVIVIHANNEQTHLFPIEGDIKLGETIKTGAESNPILLSGDISIIDKTLITRDFYVVGPFDLKPGDSFRVDNLNTQSSGFMHIDDEKGIKVSYRSKGSAGYIDRYKSEAIIVKNGILTKLYNDQTLIVLWFFALILFKLAQMLLRLLFE